MSQVSKRPLKEAVYQRIFELLLKLLTDSYNKVEAEEIINDLLTPSERVMVAKRLAIAILLSKEYSYADIKKVVHVSTETIARVNVSIKYSGKGYRNFISRILKEEEMQKFWEKIEDLVVSSATINGKGSSVWKYLKQEIQGKRSSKHTSI